MLALALVYLRDKSHWARVAELYRQHRTFVAALLALPCLVLFQIVVLRIGNFPALDPLLRLALVVPSFFFLASLDSRQLRLVQWGCVAGALWCGGWVFYQMAHPAVAYGVQRVGNPYTNPIPFGDTALVLGFLSVASIRRGTHAHWAEVTIKLVALFGGCYASYASGARGGWIALPLLIWAAVGGRHWLASTRARMAFASTLLVCAGALASTSVVRERVAAFHTDLQDLQHGDADTSTGVRFGLWRASLRLYASHPLLGVGRGGLESATRSLVKQGEGSPLIINGRAHSEFFSVLAETGTIGVAALLFLYAGTFLPFWRNRNSADADIATASYMGMTLVGGTVIFGLTIDVLTLVMNTAFFALTTATLLAWIEARKREIGEA
ncbi:O-antigen ligase family protein [Trinickia fusca]|uniref:O-antigen ligase family protein n=1 Tax=Trinickia fusca TaxID=2419777 RepID=UPI0015FFF5F1|nr:O-antigen ligase family protein [Trinickia fusca]